MRFLVTGAGGFVGKNLCAALQNIMDNKDRTHPNIKVDAIMRYDIDTAPELLGQYCADADFVFHLAGVNRPKDEGEFMAGNRDFSDMLLGLLAQKDTPCPVMLSSSAQASLEGRFAGSRYGMSKLAGEQLVFDYGQKTQAPVYVYRFPNIFGKWCRPNYNSAVATFCHNIANGLPVSVTDPDIELELLYIDDLVEAMLNTAVGTPHRCDYEGLTSIPNDSGKYCYVPTTYKVTLGRIVDTLNNFAMQPTTLVMPQCVEGSFEKKLYSAYLSYLPKEKVSFDLKMNRDDRGSFTELLKTRGCGQISVNISKPGITKGQHWHHSKWELFMVVSGRGLIRQRRLDSDTADEFYVSGDRIQAVHMIPGCTHSIINLSDSEDLVTVMWANEPFDSNRPDTYFEEV